MKDLIQLSKNALVLIQIEKILSVHFVLKVREYERLVKQGFLLDSILMETIFLQLLLMLLRMILQMFIEGGAILIRSLPNPCAQMNFCPFP